MYFVNLVDKNDDHTTLKFLIPLVNAKPSGSIGSPWVSFSDFSESVDWIVEHMGDEIGLGTLFMSITTTPSTAHDIACNAKLNSTVRLYAPKISVVQNAGGTDISGILWYIEGRDSATRYYVEFFDHPALHTPYARIYDSDGTTILYDNIPIAWGVDNDFTSHSYAGLTDYDGFFEAATLVDSRVYAGSGNIIFEGSESATPQNRAQYFNTNYGTYDWLWYLCQGANPFQEPDDDPYSGDDGPYNPGGENPGGGTRPPYDEGDPIDIPDLPPFNLANSGFTSLWIPSLTSLNLLASFMWSDNFIDTVVKKLYANPIDVIISLGIVPFNVTPDGTAEICVGTHGTGINSAYVDNDNVIIDCGSITIAEAKPGGYLNYSPYTEAQIFLPFVGFIEVDIDVIMPSTLHVEYHVSLTTGSFVVFIECTNNNVNKVIAEFEGNMKLSIPVTASDYSQMWNTIISTLTAPLLGAAGGAVGAAIEGQNIGASAALTGAFAGEGATSGMAESLSNGISGAGNMLGDKLSPKISSSGAFSSASGMLGNRKPFIVLKSPEIQQPGNYNKYRGYPLQAEKNLSELTGFTLVSNIQLGIPGASGFEIGEIDRMLRSGVIFGSGKKPSVANDGIALCNNKSPLNQIGKEVELVSQLTGDFRSNVDMMEPVVRIERSNPLGFNYVYIGEFQRWYFVNKIDVVRTGILDLYLQEDILETFRTDILKHKGIISNNADKYNVYLNDKQLITTQRNLYWRKEFPTGFYENDGYEFVLIVGGSRSSS